MDNFYPFRSLILYVAPKTERAICSLLAATESRNNPWLLPQREIPHCNLPKDRRYIFLLCPCLPSSCPQHMEPTCAVPWALQHPPLLCGPRPLPVARAQGSPAPVQWAWVCRTPTEVCPLFTPGFCPRGVKGNSPQCSHSGRKRKRKGK